MRFDEITKLLGQFGKYQKIVYFLVCLIGIFHGAQMLSSVFTLAIPDHRCQIPGLSNDTYEIQGEPHEILINKTIPWELNDDDEHVHADCEIYVTSNVTSFNQYNIPSNFSSKQECDHWVYDRSTFDSTVISDFDLICGQDLARANANMILMAGLLCGAIVMGIFSDIFGRKTSMMVSIFLHIGAAFGSAFAPNFAAFVAFRFLQGFANISMFMTAFVIGVELVGPDYRVFTGVVIEFFWCIGLYFLNLLAYFIRDWDTLQLSLAIPAVLMIALYWLVPESPRWLISKGRYDKAEVIIQKCAKVNGVKLPENVVGKDSEDDDQKQSVLKMFTVPKLLIRTLIIYLNWCVVSMVYYGLGLNVGNLDGDIYVNFAINSAMDVAAYALCFFTLNKVGRKPLHAGIMILGGVACLCTIFTVLYAPKDLNWITVVLANLGKFGISAAFAAIYVWSAELFPTNVRNSGMGSSSMCARVGGMICPYIADLGEIVDGSFGTALPLIIFGGMSVIAGVLSLFLPETVGQILPETIEDAENFVSSTSNKSTKYYINKAYDIKTSDGEYKQKI